MTWPAAILDSCIIIGSPSPSPLSCLDAWNFENDVSPHKIWFLCGRNKACYDTRHLGVTSRQSRKAKVELSSYDWLEATWQKHAEPHTTPRKMDAFRTELGLCGIFDQSESHSKYFMYRKCLCHFRNVCNKCKFCMPTQLRPATFKCFLLLKNPLLRPTYCTSPLQPPPAPPTFPLFSSSSSDIHPSPLPSPPLHISRSFITSTSPISTPPSLSERRLGWYWPNHPW